MKIGFKKLNASAVIPSYSKVGDGAMDLTATSYEYKDGRHVYGTGLAVQIPLGYVGLVFPRSSICKYDLRLTNAVGVIDSGYRGEIKFQFENDAMDNGGDYNSRQCRIYKIGDRVGQLIIIPYPKIEPMEVDSLSLSERGDGGFGSSGQ